MRIGWLVASCLIAACGGGSKSATTEPPTAAGGDGSKKSDAPASPAAAFSVAVVAATGDTAVEITARDAATGEVLAGVTFVLRSPAMADTQTAITDADGLAVFRQSVLPPGNYLVTGYYTDAVVEGDLKVTPGKLARVNVAFNTAGAGGEVVAIRAREPDFKTAREALEHGALELAIKLGEQELKTRPSAQVHAMLAIARWGFGVAVLQTDGGNSKAAREFVKAIDTFAGDLDKVQGHLAEAAKDKNFAFELCVACMTAEGSFLAGVPTGALDIERDRNGKALPENDPRRRPTYRFDHGDLAWARAMISFQQAFVNVLLAYDWDWIDTMMTGGAPPTTITIKLEDPARIAKAREQILAGLAASDECRAAYLAETDDDREWVPGPKQNSYASPLVVDARLYKTWVAIIGDVRRLVKGDDGISLKAAWAAFGSKRDAPAGFVDVSAMLTRPTDITFELGAIDRIENEKAPGKRAKLTRSLLEGILGNGLKAKMKPSRLTERLLQLRKDQDAAGTAFEDKLKYVLWLN